MEQMIAKLRSIFERHVPTDAIQYCLDLWTANPFHFKVTRRRSSKLGDYIFRPTDQSHSITINHDLNRYAFLITYVHEVAHMLTRIEAGRKVPPHGKAWKWNFQTLMRPLLSEQIFPKPILMPLRRHMMNPKASTCSDPGLIAALSSFDEPNDHLISLAKLKEGDIFEFNQKEYRKIKLQRTRVLCQQSGTNQKYLISNMALVRHLAKN
jgi:SprT protein